MEKLRSFLTRDRRYIFLTGAVMTAAGAWLLHHEPNGLSFLRGGLPTAVIAAICAAFCLLAIAALIAKLRFGRRYGETAFRRGAVLRISRLLYALVCVCFALTVLDRAVLALVSLAIEAAGLDKNPQDTLGSMLYMSWHGRSFLLYGVWTTVRIALIGTAVAFVLAILMAFLRIQAPTRRDNDLVRFLKLLGSGFARIYITVIRGTPMMVQALVFYYAGFGLFKSSGMTVTEINEVWSLFTSGLITVSLNSTAYLAEVLRGGIESIDAGQTEAARSLGMTSWQTMRKVIFPQAVKNSIPAIGNEFIINIKDSSVLSVIGVMDLMYATTSVVGIYYRSLEMYLVAAIVYLVLTYLSSLIMKGIARRLDMPARGLPSSN